MRYIRYFLIILTVIVFGALMIRLFMSNDPKDSKQFIFTEDNLAAYEKSGGELKVIQNTSMNGYLTEDGRFSISQTRYIPSIGEFQATLRFNDSTLEYIAEELGCGVDGLACENGEYFVIVLRDDTGRYYGDYKYIVFEKNIYNYCRFVFDGVDMEGVTDLWADVYRIDAADVSQKPCGSLMLYDSHYQSSEYDLDSYIKKNGKEPTSGLRFRSVDVSLYSEESKQNDSE